MSYFSPYDDKELLIKIAKGDERAFCCFFERYHQMLATHILRITRCRLLTEEIVQDVFLKIWMTREVLSEIRDVKAYLYMVSRNHALNGLKKVARERELHLEIDPELVGNMSSMESHEEVNYYGLIDEAINILPPQQKKVYLLSRHERLKYSEIADHLQLSKETVKKYLQLATESITYYLRKSLTHIIWLVKLFNF